jgi:uncharacterized Fe-S cluster-containing radical SAM superfamily protein
LTSSSRIDTDAFSQTMRGRGIDRERRLIRITSFTGSEQEKDLTEPANCGGLGRVRHFRRSTSPGWPLNPLPLDPAARALGVDSPEILRAQVFQNAVCNWRCWYCFVDFELLSGNDEHSTLLSADELVRMYLTEDEPPPMIDLTGGQPDLTPEWIPWMMSACRDAGISERVYLWSDDNLSNDYFWSRLSDEDRALMDSYNMYGKVCCFKGFDECSFGFNTKAEPNLFSRQFELMRRLLERTQLDLYAYVTLTTPNPDGISAAVADFVDRLQELDRMLPLRTVPLQIALFTPVRGRVGAEQERALELQGEAVDAWQRELAVRFDDGERERHISDVPLRVP